MPTFFPSDFGVLGRVSFSIGVPLVAAWFCADWAASRRIGKGSAVQRGFHRATRSKPLFNGIQIRLFLRCPSSFLEQ